MSEQAKEVKADVLSTDGLEEFFDVAGASGTPDHNLSETNRTCIEVEGGQPGQSSIEATDITTFISTSSAAKLVSVDSRTIRRWHGSGKVRGQFSKGKLLIAKEDVVRFADDNQILSGTSGTDETTPSGTTGTKNDTESGTAGTTTDESPGRPGQIADMSAPAIAFSDFLDRIERLSRENGELRALLEQERLESQQLRLLTSSRPKNFWERLTSLFKG